MVRAPHPPPRQARRRAYAWRVDGARDRGAAARVSVRGTDCGVAVHHGARYAARRRRIVFHRRERRRACGMRWLEQARDVVRRRSIPQAASAGAARSRPRSLRGGAGDVYRAGSRAARRGAIDLKSLRSGAARRPASRVSSLPPRTRPTLSIAPAVTCCSNVGRAIRRRACAIPLLRMGKTLAGK